MSLFGRSVGDEDDPVAIEYASHPKLIELANGNWGSYVVCQNDIDPHIGEIARTHRSIRMRGEDHFC